MCLMILIMSETNFPHKFLLNNIQVSRTPKAFANGSSGNTKLSKVQLYKTMQSRGILELLMDKLKPATRIAFEVPGIIDSINKGKSIPNCILDARYNLVNNKINVDPL